MFSFYSWGGVVPSSAWIQAYGVPAAARRATPRKGDTTRRRAANAVAAADSAPKPSARGAQRIWHFPRFPLRGALARRRRAGAHSTPAVDEKSGKRHQRIARETAAQPCLHQRLPTAHAAAACRTPKPRDDEMRI